MPNSLILSNSFDGHRQVYVYIFAHILNELGFKIFVAGNLEEKILDSTYLNMLKKDKSITFIHIGNYTKDHSKISKNEFMELQDTCDADLTIFAEADGHIPLFNSQIFNKRKFRGRTIGIFFRPFYFYEKLNFLNRLRFIKRLPSRWKADDYLFHEHLLKRFRLLDCAMYLDEYFVSRHSNSQFLPDVFQSYADILIKDENKDQRIWIEKLRCFKEKNQGKFIFLYFGTAAKRRGYDSLIKMAVEYDACFVHCGLYYEKQNFDLELSELKTFLQKSGRLFETNEYISDPLCIEYFFKSVDRLILPYRNFYGSSGVMLQALNFGIPVLAPEKGIMGYRIKKYKLGITYDDKNENNLKSNFDYFRNLDPKTFSNNIKSYMNLQSTGELIKALKQAFSIPDYSFIQPVQG